MDAAAPRRFRDLPAEPTPALGGTVPVLLRAPRAGDVTAAWVRVLSDGEPELIPARVDHEDEVDVWLRADLPVVNPVVSYRFLLDGGPHGYQWLNGTGLHGRDVADAADFRVSTFEKPPAWATATMYPVREVARPADAGLGGLGRPGGR